MHAKTTIVLVALFALIGSYLYFIEFNASPPGQPPEISGDHVGDRLLDPDVLAQVNTITLDRADESATFERVGITGWSQTQPVIFPVETASMEELIAAAASLVPIQTLQANPADQVDPQATLTFGSGQGDSMVLQLGTKTLAGRGLLSRSDLAVVYVVDDRLHQAVLDHPYRNWRKTHLDSPAAAGCSRLSVASSDQVLTLIKRKGKWFLGSDGTERADTASVEALAQAVHALTIKSFIADAPASLARFGLDKASVTVTLTTSGADRSAQVLRIGSPADMESKTYYATWLPTAKTLPVVFTMSDTDRDRFLVKADAVRDPRVMTFESTDVDRVAVHQPDSPDWVLSRTAEGFALAGSDQVVDLAKAQRWLQSLTELRGQGTAPLPKGLSDSVATVELQVQGASGPTRLHVYAQGPAKQTLWVKRDDESYAYRFSQSALAFLLAPHVELDASESAP